MLLISNNCDSIGVDYPENAVIRINTAWVNTKETLEKELNRLRKLKKQVYLDYPIGRSKPPLPQMDWKTILKITKKYKDIIRYFAWSNAERADELIEARNKLPDNIMLVPKIETLIGVLKLKEIIKASKTKYITIDKEDLSTKANDKNIYSHFLEHCIKKCKEYNVIPLEMKTVVFSEC